MATTPTYNFPAPDNPNDANGPAQVLALAQAIETLLTTGTLKMSGGAIEVSDPTGATNPVTKQYFEARLVIGPEGSAPAAGALPDGSIYYGV